jgi:LmbE family N-acetylglucosaminyl deacetylase
MVTRPLLRWSGGSPPRPKHLVVFAPHPDDEVLGAAGLMKWCQLGGGESEIVSVTDGEASHPKSRRITRSQLRNMRVDERLAALTVLGLEDTPIHRLRLPDSQVTNALSIESLAEQFAEHVTADATIAVPSHLDGHPDHVATYRAGHLVGKVNQCPVWEYAVWARLRHSNQQLGATLHLGRDFHRTKVAAAMCFRSQILPLGPGRFDGPVIDPQTLASFTSATESIAFAR